MITATWIPALDRLVAGESTAICGGHEDAADRRAGRLDGILDAVEHRAGRGASSPPRPGVTPPTTFVPKDIASSAWNVACWPGEPLEDDLASRGRRRRSCRHLLGRSRRPPSPPRRRGRRPGSAPGRSRRGSAGLRRRSCPASRTTTGTSIAWSRVAWTTPCAIQSQRLIPAKMFTRITRTFGSCSTIRNAFAIFSGLAPPPTSRKFAGRPPWWTIASIVPIARPAPFTMQPTEPSSAM